MRHTLFISDLHLEPDRPDMTQCLLSFLKQQAPQADALYILGDFFEVWIGDDQKSTFHETIITALRQLTAFGFPVYFMHGNRDFLIGERFMKATGCHFLTDPTIIELYGKRVLLAMATVYARLTLDISDLENMRAIRAIIVCFYGCHYGCAS